MTQRRKSETSKPERPFKLKHAAIAAVISAVAGAVVTAYVAPSFDYINRAVAGFVMGRTEYGVAVFDLDNQLAADETYKFRKSLVSDTGELIQDAPLSKLEEMQRTTPKRFLVDGLVITGASMRFDFTSASILSGGGWFHGMDASYSGIYIGPLRAFGKQHADDHCGPTTFWAVVGRHDEEPRFAEMLQQFINADKARAARLLKAAEESDLNAELAGLKCGGGVQSASANETPKNFPN